MSDKPPEVVVWTLIIYAVCGPWMLINRCERRLGRLMGL